ncbi:hypothetical protein B0H13DRAFT_1909880 [Mycena leptocephala]|nr:hypothetical protein B0H13DRAFT_1909880 [Mycena leptocephala]
MSTEPSDELEHHLCGSYVVPMTFTLYIYYYITLFRWGHGSGTDLDIGFKPRFRGDYERDIVRVEFHDLRGRNAEETRQREHYPGGRYLELVTEMGCIAKGSRGKIVSAPSQDRPDQLRNVGRVGRGGAEMQLLVVVPGTSYGTRSQTRIEKSPSANQ